MLMHEVLLFQFGTGFFRMWDTNRAVAATPRNAVLGQAVNMSSMSRFVSPF